MKALHYAFAEGFATLFIWATPDGGVEGYIVSTCSKYTHRVELNDEKQRNYLHIGGERHEIDQAFLYKYGTFVENIHEAHVEGARWKERNWSAEGNFAMTVKPILLN